MEKGKGMKKDAREKRKEAKYVPTEGEGRYEDGYSVAEIVKQ